MASKINSYAKWRIRRAVLSRYGAACCYCGCRLFDQIPEYGAVRMTLEHIVPQYAGGSNQIENLRPCCDSCNGTHGKAASFTAQDPELKFLTPKQKRLMGLLSPP